jgi:hypothetical protein
MYSLTIHFGPNAIQWQFLFKTEEKAGVVYNTYVDAKANMADAMLIGTDDFGQAFAIPTSEISGILLEDINAMEEARIERSLADARASAKLQGRARTDPTIRAAQQGAPVLTPMGGGFRQ